MPHAKKIRLAIIFALIFGSTNYYAEAKTVKIQNEERLDSLKIQFRWQIDLLLKWAKQNFKDDITIACAYRSPEEQNRLYRKGSSTTTKQGGQSLHQKHLAVDLYFLEDGKIIPYNDDYLKLGEKAESLGLTWGGRWKVPFDPGHFEMR